MEQSDFENELRNIGLNIAALEVATLAAIRVVLEMNPTAAEVLRRAYPAILNGLSGNDAEAVKTRVEKHIQQWLPE